MTLALEIHATEQARIDAFLDSSGDAAAREALLSGPFWAVPPERSDGRRSVAMLALLEYHARRAPPTRVGGLLPGQSPPVPTMVHLADVPMLRVNVTAERGEFWGGMGGSCQPWPLGGRRAAPANAMTGPRFQRTLQDATRWDTLLVLPEYSVARPVEVGRQR